MNTQGHTNRRQFCRNAAGLACAPLFLPGVSATSAHLPRPRSLILVEMFGGVDGLGTLIPRNDDDYRKLRPTLAIPPKELLGFDDLRGFPPHLAAFHELWDEGRMHIIDGAGYPNSSMSHFSSRVVWGAAMPNHLATANGWAARLRKHLWAKDPRPELLTHLGAVLPPSMVASDQPVLCFDRPEDMRWALRCGDAPHSARRAHAAPVARAPEDRVLAKIRNSLSVSERLGGRIQEIAENYHPRTEYPATDFGRRLRVIAGLIQSGFGSRVYSLRHKNFDMHESGYRTVIQAPMELAQGILAFMKDLKGTSAFEDTLVMCHSEFGRRPAENSAGGCDHGAAGIMFLFGGKLTGGLTGNPPSLTHLDANFNLIPSVDFRRVYAAVIEQWFKADHVPVMLEKLDVPKII